MNNFARLDSKKRNLFLKDELKVLILKTLSQDLSLPKAVRIKAQLQLVKKKQASKTRIRNRCFLSNRGKSIYKQFGISRILIRDLGHQGLIPGLSKDSW
uniref:Ribosomal protein S14 n=1 Tax=Tetraselmis sp. CCMP 881 TaxID=1812852 RepID=A0A650ARH2_9CHLO|nr:ribosomal protein S14 [Tetraselmis sp. CCMP 881]